MATNNSINHNTTLDNALEALLNDTEFCQQFDVQRSQTFATSIHHEKQLILIFYSLVVLDTTTDERVASSIEATPDPLDVAFLDVYSAVFWRSLFSSPFSIIIFYFSCCLFRNPRLTDNKNIVQFVYLNHKVKF